MNITNKIFFQISNFLAVIFTIAVNALANILPIAGKNTGELSDAIPNLFVPSGITFSIWGVIYFLLIVFAIYQARDLFSKNKIEMPYLKKISFFFILSSIANILWIFLWHYQQISLSLLAMLLLFVSLLMIYLRLNIGLEKVSLKEKICIHLPFSVYIGWITVATIANVTALLVTNNFDGLGISETMWTILIIAVATLLTIIVLLKRRDIAYSLVIIWALLGIYLKRSSFDPVYGIKTDIANTALIAIVILVIFIFVIIIGQNSKKLNLFKT
jgi:hypothetical protein